MLEKIRDKYKKIKEELKYTDAINLAAAMTNHETFSDIKNINSGKEIALCGAGPSLKDYKPIKGIKHVALNRALLNKNIKYDCFIADDWLGLDFFKDELAAYDCEKYFGFAITDPERIIPESFRIKCNAKRYYTDCYMVGGGFESRFVCDIDKMAVGNMPNVALQALQILLFTNPKRIYLVGCDASKGHFVNPDKMSDERKEKENIDSAMAVSADATKGKWLELKEFAGYYYPDTEIVSVNPVGLKGLFRDIYQ